MLIGLLAYISLRVSFFIDRQAFCNLTGCTLCVSKILPAGFARLPWMAAVIVAPPTASAAKTMAATTRTF